MKKKPEPINFEAVCLESLPRSWAGHIESAAIAYTKRDGHLIRDNSDGAIYASTGRHRLLLDAPESIRRAWCKLTGHTNASVSAARKTWMARQEKVRTSERAERLRREAGRLGYRLIKN